MFVLKSIKVLPALYTRNKHCHLCLETHNLKPGFARLRVVDISCNYHSLIGPSVIEMDDNTYVSSSSFVHRSLAIWREGSPHLNLSAHGPCTSGPLIGPIDVDRAVCLRCPVWPNEALEWIHRYRPNNWPSTELVQQIASEGCLLVPIGNPQSDMTCLEWRISFSVAERTLIYSMNHTQLLCYGLLKLYLKNVIDSNEELNGLLCSYFLKTSLFYCIEEEHILWNKENLIKCFWICFRRLQFWVREGYCPSYFIKDNNMFESKIHGENQRKLLQYLSVVYEQGLDTLAKIPCLTDLARIAAISSISGISGRTLHSFLISEPENEFWCDIALLPGFFGIPLAELVAKTHMVMPTLVGQPALNKVEKVLFSSALFSSEIYLSQKMNGMKAYLPVTNKERFKMIRRLKQFMLSFVHYDICTSLLQYATLCYILGQYGKVTHIVKHVLKKFNDFTMFIGRTRGMIRNKYTYMAEVCGRGLTAEQKRKHYVAYPYVCLPEFEMYPPEIRTEIFEHSYKGTFIPPVVYCKVLLFLAYNALGYNEDRNSILVELDVAAHDEDVIEDFERSLSIALLDKCIGLANLN